MRGSRYLGSGLILLIYLFLLAPFLIVLISSFNASSFLTFPPQGFSLQWYARIFTNPDFMAAFRRSVSVSAAVSALDLVLGVSAALSLVRGRFAGRDLLSTFFMAPLMIPSIVMALAALLAFSKLHLVAKPAGLILAHVVITLPFVIRITMAALSTLEAGVEEAALNLGAGPWQTFRRVTLPLAFPGIVAGAVISFILSFDELVLTLFLAGPRFTTLPVVMFHYVEAKTDPLVAALSTLLVMLSLVAVVVAERAVGLSAVYGSRK